MEKLIEMVRGFPVLYDTSHEDYKRPKLKDDLWENIAKELNTSVVERRPTKKLFPNGDMFTINCTQTVIKLPFSLIIKGNIFPSSTVGTGVAQAAKDQWRKLRECHREALRRQQKKSGQQATHIRLWTYQKQMEFLKPFMKNRNIVGNPTSPLEESQLATLPCEDSQLEEFDIPPSDEPKIEATNDGEPTEPFENVHRKRLKKSTITNDPVMQNCIEDSDKRAKKRNELRQNLIAETQKQEELNNDALYQFFMSMYNITKGLPTKYQREVRRNLFQAVSDAEDKVEDEITDKCKVEQNYQMNK